MTDNEAECYRAEATMDFVKENDRLREQLRVAREALEGGVYAIRQIRDYGPGLIAHHSDALEAMIAALDQLDQPSEVDHG